jgi:hypothetical protein
LVRGTCLDATGPAKRILSLMGGGCLPATGPTKRNLGLVGGTCLDATGPAKRILSLMGGGCLPATDSAERNLSLLPSSAKKSRQYTGATLLTVMGSTAHCSTLLTPLGYVARNGPSLGTAGSLAHSSRPPCVPTNHPTASAMWQPCRQLHPPRWRALHALRAPLVLLQEPRAQS